MLNDLRYAVRTMLTHPWFSLAIIVTLALGIGINTTVFTLVNAVLLKPVPLPNGSRLVTVLDANLTDSRDDPPLSYPEIRDYQSANRTFDAMEPANLSQAVISESGIPPERVSMAQISSGLFAMIHTPPEIGRAFQPGDEKSGSGAVLLLGHDLWQRRYAGATDVIGRIVRINGTPTTIVGVMPDGFKFPENEELWTPLVVTPDLDKRSNRQFWIFGLLKPGISISAAQRDLSVIAAGLTARYPDTNKDIGVSVRSFHQTYTGVRLRAVMLMMLGAVGLVLLIACANVANMMLGRALDRSQEFSVRAALGASRWQLIRQMLVESVLLSSLGGLLGLGVAAFGIHAFDLATQDVGKPFWIIFSMDYVAFGYFAAISVSSGILFGLVPALRASRVDLNTAIKADARSGGSRDGGRLTGALVISQVALTLVLLAAAGMMVRSFFAAATMNSFVPAEHIFTARIQLPEDAGERYFKPMDRLHFHEKLQTLLAAIPGVSQVADATSLPGLGSNTRDIEIEDHPNENPKQLPNASLIVATPSYLPLIGLPILAGRAFDDMDGANGKEAAIVTRDFAAKYWPNQNALAKRFRCIQDGKPGAWMNVVGVCADIVQDSLSKDQPPLFYITDRQEAWGWMAILLRTSADPDSLAAPVRAAVQSLDGELPLFEVRTLPVAIGKGNWPLTVFGTVFTVFALNGHLMAALGIYAVVAQSTARRTREIGIRMALGSSSVGIIRLVLSRGLVQLTTGLALGLAGAFGATHLLTQSGLVVNQVSANDPIVFIGITALLVTIGMIACWYPARRAAKVNPIVALRCD
jgi:putative ABC transport system permease protein